MSIKRHTTSDFIDISRSVHGYKYDYSMVKYTSNHEKVVIICPIHGRFEQRASNHKRGKGCDYCGGTKSIRKGKFLDQGDGTYLIPVTRGEYALIDADDWLLIKDYAWQLKSDSKNKYAKTTIKVNGDKINLKMHRVILGLSDPAIHVDHINHNGLDNRRCNIRLCNSNTNSHNTRPRGGTSIYKGVFYQKRTGSYVSYITVNKKKLHIGCFKNEIEAAKSYDEKAKEFFGEFAYLNFK